MSFKELIEKSKNHLPTEIKTIKWDGTLFYMGGENWNFNSFADWVVVNDDAMIIGCHNSGVEDFINQVLTGIRIVELTHPLDPPIYDPIFKLENGMKLKFFSTMNYDSWTLGFDDKLLFVAVPGEKHWNL